MLYQYADAGLVRDITADLAEDGWGESFGQAGLALYADDGKNYGVPWRMGMVGFWYHMSLFEAGRDRSRPDDLGRIPGRRGTTESGWPDADLLGEGDKWPAHFYWVYLAIRNGGKAAFDAAYSREGSFADPPFVKAGEDLLTWWIWIPSRTDSLGTTFPDASATLCQLADAR